MQNAKAEALHDLICDMLRGPHLRQMPGADLTQYIYKAGVALHNLPFALIGDQAITAAQLYEVNALDPNVRADEWGPWASNLAAAFGIPLPIKQTAS